MRISDEDEKETMIVGLLIKKIEHIDAEYVNKESDKIAQTQPFLLSLILGYSSDLKALELEEIIKAILLIWEFFKNHSRVERRKISETQFARVQNRNVYMLHYFEGEQGNAKMELVTDDLEHLRSKSLFTGIIFLFHQKDALLNMNSETKGIVLIGLKSLIECFEEIVFEK